MRRVFTATRTTCLVKIKFIVPSEPRYQLPANYNEKPYSVEVLPFLKGGVGPLVFGIAAMDLNPVATQRWSFVFSQHFASKDAAEQAWDTGFELMAGMYTSQKTKAFIDRLIAERKAEVVSLA